MTPIMLRDAKPGRRYKEPKGKTVYYLLNGSGIPGWVDAKSPSQVLCCVDEPKPTNPRPVNGNQLVIPA